MKPDPFWTAWEEALLSAASRTECTFSNADKLRTQSIGLAECGAQLSGCAQGAGDSRKGTGGKPAEEVLRFSVSLDERTYRVGDPIRVDLAMSNPTDRDYRIIVPRPPSPARSTLAYGIVLERLQDRPVKIVNLRASSAYPFSYPGPPELELLVGGQTVTNSICLHYWLREHNVWPLPDGRYRLEIVFDSSLFPYVKWSPGSVGRWRASEVTFDVSGAPREDPDDVWQMIVAKARYAKLKEDLVSSDSRSQFAAWRVLFEYGDTRIQSTVDALLRQGSHSASNRSLPTFRKPDPASKLNQVDTGRAPRDVN